MITGSKKIPIHQNHRKGSPHKYLLKQSLCQERKKIKVKVQLDNY